MTGRSRWAPGPRVLARSVGRSAARLARAASRWLLTEDPVHLGTVLGVLLLGTGLRLAHLDQPMRLDEAVTVLNSAGPHVPLLRSLTTYGPNNHPLNTFLIQVTARLLGSIDPWVVRLPAFLFGCLTPLLAYVLGRLHYDRQAGLLAAGLVAASSPLILYSTNARGYTALADATLLLLILAHHARRSRQPAVWVAWAVTIAAAGYAHPAGVYPVGVAVTWLALALWRERRGRARWNRLGDLAAATVAGGALTALLYLPLALPGGIAPIVANRWVRPLPAETFVDTIGARLVRSVALWADGMPEPVMWLLLLGLAVALAGHRYLSRAPALAPAIALAMGGALLLTRPDLIARRWLLFLLPPFLVVAAGGLAGLVRAVPRPGWRPLLAALLTTALAGAGAARVVRADTVRRSGETHRFAEARMAHELLKRLWQPGDVVVTRPRFAAMILQYYQLRDRDPGAPPLRYLTLEPLDDGVVPGAADADRVFFILDVRWPPRPAPDAAFEAVVGAGRSAFGPLAPVARFERHRLFLAVRTR